MNSTNHISSYILFSSILFSQWKCSLLISYEFDVHTLDSVGVIITLNLSNVCDGALVHYSFTNYIIGVRIVVSSKET